MRHKFSLFAVVIMFAIASCKQNVPQLAVYIPKDAASVIIIDAKAITDKISSSGITLDSLANMMNKNETGLHWSDIENSGIDLTKSFFVFSKQNSSMQTGKMQSFGLVAAVSDKNKLEAFLKKQVEGAQTKSDSKYQYIDLGNGSVAGWTDKVMIISGVTTGSENNADEAQSHLQLTTLFTQTESNSLASISEFKDAINKPGDIHFWSNASGSLSSVPMLGMTKIGELFKDTYTDGTIDFENGKTLATAETHFNKTFSDMLDKYPSKEIDKSMISRYPKQVNGFGIVAFNPKVLVDILRYLGFDVMANGYASNLGFTTDDIVNAFSGNIAIVFSDFKMGSAVPQMPGMQTKKPGGEFLVNMAVGDKIAFNKVMTGLINKNILSKNGDQYQLGAFGGHGFVIEATSDNLFIASDDALVKAYEAGNNKSVLTNNIEKEINNKSMAIYIDVAGILQKTNASDTANMKVMQSAQATFKNVIASTDKSDDKSVTGNFELNFVNTGENSLASLIKFLSVAHEEKMNKGNNWNSKPPFSGLNNNDSTEDNNAPDKDSQ